jgi:uncharacterized membrane protein YedE/YeeE
MNPEWLDAFTGGVIIGTAVSLMLVFNGRVTGVSGIFAGVLSPVKGDTLWRIAFVLGLIVGGWVLYDFRPEFFSAPVTTSNPKLIIAGFLVGFGTLLGNGCTSGHGVCGISRLSPRSILATLTFICAGVLTVTFINTMGWLS